MKRKVPYVIVGILMLVLLSSSIASATVFGTYGDQEISALDAALQGYQGDLTLVCRWRINEAAGAQSNLTVDISVNGVIVGRNISANSYPMDGTAWKLIHANTYFPSAATYTVKIQFVNSGENASALKSNNDKSVYLAPTKEWYAAIVNGFGWLTYTLETATDQVPFDIPYIGAYLPMIIVFVVVVVILWWYLRRRKRKKFAGGRPQQPQAYRPPQQQQYEPPAQQQQYYGRRRY